MCHKTVEHTIQNKCVPTTTMNALNSFDDKKNFLLVTASFVLLNKVPIVMHTTVLHIYYCLCKVFVYMTS